MAMTSSMDNHRVNKNSPSPKRRLLLGRRAFGQLLHSVTSRVPIRYLWHIPKDLFSTCVRRLPELPNWIRERISVKVGHSRRALPQGIQPRAVSRTEGSKGSAKEAGTGALVGYRSFTETDTVTKPFKGSRRKNNRRQLLLSRRELPTKTVRRSDDKLSSELEVYSGSMSLSQLQEPSDEAYFAAHDSLPGLMDGAQEAHQNLAQPAEPVQQRYQIIDEHHQQAKSDFTVFTREVGECIPQKDDASLCLNATVQSSMFQTHDSLSGLMDGAHEAHQNLAQPVERLEQRYQIIDEHHQQAKSDVTVFTRKAGECIPRKDDASLCLNTTVQSSMFQIIEKEHEDVLRLKAAQSQGDEQRNAISGSYGDESAKPGFLNDALFSTKTAVKRFHKTFVAAARSIDDPASTVDLLNPDHFYARDNHVNYATKGAVCDNFFEGFENESFNTMNGTSKFLNPSNRQESFYRYYVDNRRQQAGQRNSVEADPQFEEFCEMKASRLLKMFNLRRDHGHDKKLLQLHCLKALGDGHELISSFRAAAKSVWLLHKLAFSFEPPASIFRVQSGVDIDPDYMESVVSLEDSKRFVQKVGFMITPGLRLQNTVLRCEVYLSDGRIIID